VTVRRIPGALTVRQVTLLVVCWLAGAVTASGQVLLTGETGGSGAQAVSVTANLISAKGFGDLTNFWGQFGYGVTDRVDIFATYGAITVFGKTQHYASVGSNVGILQHRQHGLDVSFFSSLSVPMTRRDEAATLLLTVAFVASHPLNLGSLLVTPYGGLEAVIPVGDRARGVFTPVETLHAGIVGVAIPLRKTWTASVEYNPGPSLRSGGVGIAVTIPR
jgi:hypothetical protein